MAHIADVSAQYLRTRGVEPLRLLMYGPPMSGRGVVCVWWGMDRCVFKGGRSGASWEGAGQGRCMCECVCVGGELRCVPPGVLCVLRLCSRTRVFLCVRVCVHACLCACVRCQVWRGMSLRA